jgi:hypothetical protein
MCVAEQRQHKLYSSIFTVVILKYMCLSSFFVVDDVGAALISSSLLDDHLNEIESYAEKIRPRCSPWISKGNNHFIAHDGIFNPEHLSSSAKITISPTYFDEAGWFEVSWSGLPRVEPLTFWIGIYLAGENVTDTAPIKYLMSPSHDWSQQRPLF